MEYQYIQSDSDEIDYNRDGQLSNSQRDRLIYETQKTEKTIKLLFIASIVGGALWLIASLSEYERLAQVFALITLLFVVLSMFLIVSIQQIRLIQVNMIEGTVKLHKFTNKIREVLNPDTIVIEFLEHKRKFRVAGSKFKKFDTYSTYRMYYTQTPRYILSIHKVDEAKEAMIKQMDEERLTLWQ